MKPTLWIRLMQPFETNIAHNSRKYVPPNDSHLSQLLCHFYSFASFFDGFVRILVSFVSQHKTSTQKNIPFSLVFNSLWYSNECHIHCSFGFIWFVNLIANWEFSWFIYGRQKTAGMKPRQKQIQNRMNEIGKKHKFHVMSRKYFRRLSSVLYIIR